MEILEINKDYPRIVKLFLEKIGKPNKEERKMIVEFMMAASKPIITTGKPIKIKLNNSNQIIEEKSNA